VKLEPVSMEIPQMSAGPNQRTELLKWTSDIVAAYLSRNQMNLKQLPLVMETVYAKLASLGGPDAVIPAGSAAEGTTVAEKSVTPDYIICLEDGARLKTMKRYLARKYRMTPEQYRVKWGLPLGYPMVAPNYAAKRSALAKEMGLGRGKKSGRRPRRRG
jgi:predicted transcriptional regulator